MTLITFAYKNRAVTVAPSMRLVCDIEAELGSLPMLRQKFSCYAWKVGELVTVVHMLLQAAGIAEDYMVLGDEILKTGLAPFLKTVREMLEVAGE